MHRHSFIFVVVITLLLVASAPTTNASLLRGHNKIDRGDDSRQIPNAQKETKRRLESEYSVKKAKYPQKGDNPPQQDVTLGNKLLDAYEKSVDLGTIKNPSSSSNPTSQKETDPIATLIAETITAALSKMGGGKEGQHMKIRIENDIIGNTFANTNINGLNFSPVITVTNDMHDSLHDNNKAHSDKGNVFRQNGVADFTGALQDNNNAFSTDGDVLRQNGVISGGTGDDDTSSDTAATPSGNFDGGLAAGSVVGDDTAFTSTVATVATDSNNDDEDSIIIINRIINNTFTTNKQNGLIVTPKIDVENNMSNALYNNNGATSIDGDVRRQNGVADFTNALKGNNNAYSKKGDVVRQNGIITAGDFTAEDAQDLLDSLLDFLKDLESFLPNLAGLIEELFNGVINVLETLIVKAGSNILPSELLLSISPNESKSGMKFKDAMQIQDYLLDFLSEIKANGNVMVLFEPITSFLESIPEILKEQDGKEQQFQEDASPFPPGFEELPEAKEDGKEQQVEEDASPFPSGFEELPEEEDGMESQVQEDASPFPSGFDEVEPKHSNEDYNKGRNIPLQKNDNNNNNNNNNRRRHLRRRNNGSPRNNNANNSERRRLGKGDDVANNNNGSSAAGTSNNNSNKCSESNLIGSSISEETSAGGDHIFTGLAVGMVASNMKLEQSISDSVEGFVADLSDFF
ncbi:hypothetical protein FRACYDRAFT_248077 [Fragilariopsis cylindrus CCMP1102]|uniref:Uncharacterized protein n=1 Tax=Fragilariopsis cylindrus CCMP1102 TaxID=635003 RepID=A0A1E7EVD8_9STRA|nr:hypothetical protein FRACYDRAFT_248077 [Fragilariopsis cylindrus CCMP1102]|eukprot:OEU09819.1 hypothetical protein FRACYDRAFT_248077 [Fragilariopsis cylindrus CCMP1102]